jgi:hypothetical protein
MNKKLQEKKKKRREREAKGKVLRRREVMRKKRKYDEGLDKDAASSEKIMPIINPYKEKQRKEQALAHNMEILRKLEEEYKREQSKRVKVNSDLEAAGHTTLQDKVRAMGEKATEAAGGISLIEKTKRVLESRNLLISDDSNELNIDIAPQK